MEYECVTGNRMHEQERAYLNQLYGVYYTTNEVLKEEDPENPALTFEELFLTHYNNQKFI